MHVVLTPPDSSEGARREKWVNRELEKVHLQRESSDQAAFLSFSPRARRLAEPRQSVWSKPTGFPIDAGTRRGLAAC